MLIVLTYEIHGDLLYQGSVAGLTVCQAPVHHPVLPPLHLPHHQDRHRGLEATRLAEDAGGRVEGHPGPGPGQQGQGVA